jgi:hypothetical protein
MPGSCRVIGEEFVRARICGEDVTVNEQSD